MQSISRQVDSAKGRKETTPTSMPRHLLLWGQRILYISLILGPLISFPPAKVFYNSLDTPRRLLLMLAAGLLTALIIKAWTLRRQIVLRWHYLDTYVLLYFLGTIVSSIGGAYPRVSFFGPVWSQDGLVVIWISVGLYFASKEFFRTPEEIERALTTMVYVGAFSAIIGFINRVFPMGLNPNFDKEKLVATLGNPMFTATFFAMLVPVGFGLALAKKDRNGRIITLGSTVLMFFALILTLQRAAWIGFAVAFIVLLILSLLQYRREHAQSAEAVSGGRKGFQWTPDVIAVAIFLGVMVAAIPIALHNQRIHDRLMSIADLQSDTVLTRKVYMRASINMFLANPIQGSGVGNLKALFPQYRPSSLVLENSLPLNRGYSTAYPHNIFIETAAETGLLGLIPFILLVFMVFRTALQSQRGSPWQNWLAIGFTGSLVAYFVTNQFAFDNQATSSQFYIFAGLMAGLTAQERVFPAAAANSGRLMPWRTSSNYNYLSLFIAAIAVLAFFTQFIASVAIQTGGNLLGHVNEALSVNPEAGYKMATEAVDDIRASITYTLVPDNVPYEMLCMASRMEKEMLGDQPHRDAARRDQVKAAEDGLALMDRDPLLLRYVIMEYATLKRPDELQRGDQLIAKLLRYEPNSAEVRVIAAELMMQENKPADALKVLDEAVHLDGSFKEVYAKRAHDRQVLIQQYDSDTTLPAEKKRKLMDASMKLVAADYAKAEQLGLSLMTGDQLEYTIDLFALGHTDDAIAEGRKLWNAQQVAPEFTQLCKELPAIYHTYHRPLTEVGPVLAKMRDGMPGQAPPSPTSAPGAPMAPPPAGKPNAPNPVLDKFIR